MAETVLTGDDPERFSDAYRRGSREGYADGLRDATARAGLDPMAFFWLGVIFTCVLIGGYIVVNDRRLKGSSRGA